MRNIPLAFLVGLLVVPVASATTAGTTLYFHLNGFQDFPINTQRPSDLAWSSSGLGLATESTNCLPANGVTDALTQHKYHTYYGFSSPSFVEYNFTEDGKPRIHTERGLADNVTIDSNRPVVLCGT